MIVEIWCVGIDIWSSSGTIWSSFAGHYSNGVCNIHVDCGSCNHHVQDAGRLCQETNIGHFVAINSITDRSTVFLDCNVLWSHVQFINTFFTGSTNHFLSDVLLAIRVCKVETIFIVYKQSCVEVGKLFMWIAMHSSWVCLEVQTANLHDFQVQQLFHHAVI